MVMGIKIGIIGVTGYVGIELARILSRHPEVESIAAVSKDFSGSRLDQVYPHLRGQLHTVIRDYDAAPEVIASSDVTFTALPHGLSAPLAREALRQGSRLIDMAADFRLPDPAVYEQWYGQPHQAPELLPQAVYGLSEIFRDKIRQARLIANPGCYPTCSLLALAPLLKHRVIEPQVIIDAKSGVSGAGCSTVRGNLFSECNEDIKAYGVGKHRHTPEISCYATQLAAGPVQVTFTPHLIPMTRGMLCTIYATLSQELATAEINQLYRHFYQGERFVEISPEGEWPQTNWVRGGNSCFIGALAAGQRLIVISVIDNLVKGAAGQAVQNMNISCGFPETAGLDAPGLYL
jgi:N-acetyl-gamma-glutamyl-phosphate reductase